MYAYWDWTSLYIYIITGIVCYWSCSKVKSIELYTGRRQKVFNLEYFVWYILWLVMAVWRHIELNIGGTDAYNYMTYFEICLDPNSHHRYVTHLDILYKLLNQTVRLITSDYHVLFFIIYTIILLSYILVINEFVVAGSSLIPVVSLIYLYLRGFNTIRTNLSVALILLSMVFLRRNHKMWAIVLAIASIFVQKASMLYAIYIIFYFIYEKKGITVKGCLIYTVLAAIVGRIAQSFLTAIHWSFLDDGAYVSYIGRSLTGSFFDNFWKICFSQLLLGAALIVFRKGISKYISNLDEEHQKSMNFIRLMCYFDMMTIPITYILGIWRGYEYFYILRLVMWGTIINIVCGYFDTKSKKIVKACFFVVFIIWVISRLDSSWESSSLMPYVFDLF